MRFHHRIPLAAGGVTVNPRTTPLEVPAKNVITVPAAVTGTDVSPQSMVLALEGTAANTAVVQPWIIEDPAEASNLQFQETDLPERTNRKYYQYGAAITLTVGQAQLLTGTAGAATTIPLPCPVGRVYLQVTTGPAAAGDLKVGWLGA